MTTSVFIRTESNPAFATNAQTVRVHDNGIENSVPLPAGEEVELLIHDGQYLMIKETDAEEVDGTGDGESGDGDNGGGESEETSE